MARKRQTQSNGYTTHNSADLISGGHEYFTCLVELIDSAEHSIHFQTYIFDEDETGNMVADALIRAAQRGVKVYLVLDGYASQKLSREFVLKIKSAGIQFRWFAPLMKSKYFYFGRRLHHKVVVVDCYHGLVGGVNVSNKYNDTPEEPAWLDWAVHVQGEVAGELFGVCVDIWRKSWWGKGRKFDMIKQLPVRKADDVCKIRVRINDWIRRRNQITRSYLEMLLNAKKSVTIVSSYFLPGKALKKRVSAASKRGVEVRVVMACKSDIMFAKYAERHLYNWMLRHNVKLYEYKPHVLHGKVSSYDGEWVTVGSYNVNNISAFASIELNLDVQDEKFVKVVDTEIQNVIDRDCDLISPDKHKKSTNPFHIFWYRLCYESIRAMFYVSTFYFKQRNL